MKTHNKSIVYSGVTTYCSSYHFTDDPRVSKRIPETLVAQIGNLSTREETYFFVQTQTCNMLYHFIPMEQSDITYILISPQKENETEMKYLITLSRKMIQINGMSDVNMKNISTRRNTLENFYQLYDHTPMYLRVPTLIPTFKNIISNYILPNTFTDGVKQLDGFGLVVGGYFRPFTSMKNQLSIEENICLTVWSNTLVKTYLADSEIREDEYLGNEFQFEEKTDGLKAPPVSVEDCNKQLVINPVEFKISTNTSDWILAVQKITNNMLVIGFLKKGEILIQDFKETVKKIYPVLMMFRSELTLPSMSMIHPFNYRTAYPGMVHFIVIDHFRNQTFYPSFDPPELEIQLKKFIIDCRESNEFKILYTRNQKYIFAFEKTYRSDQRKETKIEFEVYAVFVKPVPYSLVHDYTSSALKNYKDIYLK
ncbi:hypothetical protein EDI_106690 [Entamoeba dispar SAW760]|uniref:Uncharacterized protein n=1 Tax=Entamoeba dispar (strain ATCC PRA-260 / SAW760) TaxID=370354 RepID=B0ET47_ENTDS|nr:uncharacterized protein EDI_106690 [Entamoeba dispar SAW760]EDR22300.1 hypothetical protein EDI_106690 [Entamoeba dispar SAW760]|eukprot:EDR22300.1 hypothetical protein EDI_106690 [Entamoeba dispar SAW760]